MGSTNREQIREFLALPPETTPEARFAIPGTAGNPREWLQAAVLAEPWPRPVPDWSTHCVYLMPIWLRAAEDDWRHGQTAGVPFVGLRPASSADIAGSPLCAVGDTGW